MSVASSGKTSRRGPTIAGIPLELPWSSLLGVAILTWLFAPGFTDPEKSSTTTYLIAAAFALLVYATILLHELAHAGAARSFGFPVHNIRLYALGGYTTYERTTPTPGRELVIAIAGPAATLAIAGVCWAAGNALNSASSGGSVVVDMLLQLGYVGLVLGLYNLLPGLPLDGGALVKCPIWKFSGSEALGTRVAAGSGMVVAALIFAIPFIVAARNGRGQLDTTSVITVAVFAGWLGFGAFEAFRSSTLQGRLPNLDSAGLSRRAITVRQDTPLSVALAQLGEQSAGAIVIVDADGTPSAIANEAAITAVPQQRRAWVTVGSVSRAIVPDTVLNTELRGEALLRAMSNFPIPEYLVVDSNNQIFGVLSTDDVHVALAGKRAQPKGLAT